MEVIVKASATNNCNVEIHHNGICVAKLRASETLDNLTFNLETIEGITEVKSDIRKNYDRIRGTYHGLIADLVSMLEDRKQDNIAIQLPDEEFVSGAENKITVKRCLDDDVLDRNHVYIEVRE